MTSVSKDPRHPIYVFVFAHPDDESMFFLPTIRWLADHNEQVWFLCLTTGNYDGLGKIREKELERAGKLLGASKVIVRNDSDGTEGFLDHPTNRYEKEIVANAIRESLSVAIKEDKRNPKQGLILITFDEIGVSGHVNHTDVYRGVVHLIGEAEAHKESFLLLDAWYLESKQNILAKYIPFGSWVVLLLSFVFVSKPTSTSTVDKKSNSRIFRLHNPRLNWAAMATHRSQFVWYRRLFVVFSCYTYHNKLKCNHSSTIQQ